jgi:peptide chain release factor 3
MTDNALAAAPIVDTSPPGRISAEAGRRRTFAVISHPDAGKSTLTEALALHAPGHHRSRRGPRQGGPPRDRV